MKRAAQSGLSVVAANVTMSVPDARDSRERKTLLKDVSFRINPGDFVCVLGPSGATANSAAGARRPTSGSG